MRCAKYVRTGPAIVSVSTHTTAARIAARRAADPNRCSDCCSAASAMDCLIELETGCSVGVSGRLRDSARRAAPARGATPARGPAGPASPPRPTRLRRLARSGRR